MPSNGLLFLSGTGWRGCRKASLSITFLRAGVAACSTPANFLAKIPTFGVLVCMIYVAHHVVDGKPKHYVGQTIWPLERRRKRHECLALRCGSKTYFHNALKKYGPDSFEWEALTPFI